MANASGQGGPRDPLRSLAFHIECAQADVEHLTLEQKFALHEFFHTVLAAGYKLYQVVPAALAAPVIRQKFGLIINPDPNQDPAP
jgi:hypothetical protein